MKKIRVMLVLLVLTAMVIGAAYWLQPVNLADEIFMQNQGSALLWSVVANVVLGIGILVWVSMRQERKSLTEEEIQELKGWRRWLQVPWQKLLLQLGAAVLLCALIPLLMMCGDPLNVRVWWIVFLSLGILWIGFLIVDDEFPEASARTKLFEMLKRGLALKSIIFYLLLINLFCLWLWLASQGVSGLWMFYNPLYLLPALVILYFCLGKMRYFSLVLIWFLMFPALAIIAKDLTTEPVVAEESIEVPNVM